MYFFQTIQNLFKITNYEISLITLDRNVANNYKYIHICIVWKKNKICKTQNV